MVVYVDNVEHRSQEAATHSTVVSSRGILFLLEPPETILLHSHLPEPELHVPGHPAVFGLLRHTIGPAICQ
jgi:hypothetical protein